jgi:hypothetical protein
MSKHVISDPDLAEYVAAMIIEEAAKYPLGVSSEINKIYDLPERFGFDADKSLVDHALKVLADCGIAVISDDRFAGRFVSVTKESFDDFLEYVGKDREEYNRILRSADDEFEGFNRAESRHYPHLETYNKYKALRRYAQFRSPWLREVIRRLKADETPEAVQNEPDVDSSAWTGLPPTFSLTNERRETLISLLSAAEEGLSELKDNTTKAQARAYIIAAKHLADAPEPPADLIWEIVQRASNLAGVASLFISIIALFSAAG